MFVKLLILLVFAFGCVYSEVYSCQNAYNPSDHIGELRVQTNCKVEQLNCPPSWKSGIPEGSETSLPMVYRKFLTCHEGLTSCGYVPIKPNSGEVLGQSGVTIGAGVDLGSRTRASFTSLSNALVDKLEPYFGLKQNLAACAAIERPLQLTLAETNTLTDAVIENTVDEASKRYDREKVKSALAFASIPRGIRTAIVSVWHQFGSPAAYPKFWGFITRNDWDNAVKELRNFYPNPKDQQPGDLRRRNDEADIIEATLVKCNRSVDLVFLLDESGSIKLPNFQESLDFVKNIIKAFSDEKLSGTGGTRFGLSTFSNNYKSHFYLSSYTNQASYLSAIDRVSYRGGNTYLGDALQRILTDQFNETRGLRPEVDGLPRILIILTDGEATDSISIPTQNVRDESIVVYAIGIADYNIQQLQNISSSESHVYTLSAFSDLEKFISTITSSTCYEPRPASLSKTIITNVAKDDYQYFIYNVKPSSNLVIRVNDLRGNTVVYASRTNPHPYKYDHDVAFELSSQKNKEIVISAEALLPNGKMKRSIDSELKQIYVSVSSDTDSASFMIEANECDPSNCTEGTNESPTTTQPPTTQPKTTQISTEASTTQFLLPSTSERLTIEPSTIQPSTTADASVPTWSARVVSATNFMVVNFAILKTSTKPSISERLTIEPSTIQPSTKTSASVPTCSARVVCATKFMVVSFVILKILLGTFDI